MDLNVKGPFFLTQALYPLLKAAASQAQPAKVINIGSIDGIRLNPWETYSYHASKSAILYLTKRIAARLVQDQINVTAIAPGAFASDMNKAARDHGEAVAQRIPNKRIGVAEIWRRRRSISPRTRAITSSAIPSPSMAASHMPISAAASTHDHRPSLLREGQGVGIREEDQIPKRPCFARLAATPTPFPSLKREG